MPSSHLWLASCYQFLVLFHSDLVRSKKLFLFFFFVFLIYFGESSMSSWQDYTWCSCRMEYSEHVSFKSVRFFCVSLLLFYMNDLSIGEREVLKSFTITVLWHMYIFVLIGEYFMRLAALIFGVYVLKIIMFLWIFLINILWSSIFFD